MHTHVWFEATKHVVVFATFTPTCVVGFRGQSLSKANSFPNRFFLSAELRVRQMTHAIDTTVNPSSSPIIRRCYGLICMLLIMVSGGCCSQVRLPAIDPTGACLFAPKPTTTTFALPCCNSDNCMCLRPLKKIGDHVHGLKDHLHNHVHGLGLKCKEHHCKDPSRHGRSLPIPQVATNQRDC